MGVIGWIYLAMYRKQWHVFQVAWKTGYSLITRNWIINNFLRTTVFHGDTYDIGNVGNIL